MLAVSASNKKHQPIGKQHKFGELIVTKFPLFLL